MATQFAKNPVWLDTLLDAAEVLLSQKTGLPRDCVFASVLADAAHLEFPPADRFVTVFPASFPLDQGTFAGGGRVLCGFNGRIRVTAFTRFAADQELRSARLLRDPTRGVLNLVLKVIDAMSYWQPLHADGSCYLREPARMDPGFEFQPKNAKDGSPWAVVQTNWSIKFTAALPSGNS